MLIGEIAVAAADAVVAATDAAAGFVAAAAVDGAANARLLTMPACVFDFLKITKGEALAAKVQTRLTGSHPGNIG